MTISGIDAMSVEAPDPVFWTSRASTKIGVNLLWLVPGVVGGSEGYITALLHGLLQVPAEQRPEIILFALPSFAAAHPVLAANFPVVVAPVSGRRRPIRVAVENSWLAVAARRRRIALMHHAGGTMPFLRLTPAVVTVHDLQYRTYPEYFRSIKRRFLAVAMPMSARRARLVLTSSDFVRTTVVQAFGIATSHVAVIPHGADVVTPERTSSIETVRLRYGLAGPFFVYPAITYPHKNHLLLLDALAEVVTRHPDVRLVLTGGEAQMEAAIVARSVELGLSDHVRRTGRVRAADLECMYENAIGLLFPSQYEGFGLPVVEAMRKGCPVVAADNTALPEVVGEAGLLASSDSAHEWAIAMNRLLDDETLRSTLSVAGRERAAQFSAVASAHLLIAAYRLALATPP